MEGSGYEPHRSDSLSNAPQAREPTSLGRFLVRMCSKENRERLGKTISAMRRVPEETLRLGNLLVDGSDDPIVYAQIFELYRMRMNMLQVAVIIRTACISPQLRKTAVLEYVNGIGGGRYEDHFVERWQRYRHHMRLVDLLAAPGAIGRNLIGLAMLFPSDFTWFDRCGTSLVTGESMEATVMGVLERVPELRQLVVDLIPYGIWLAGRLKGPQPPPLKGVEVF